MRKIRIVLKSGYTFTFPCENMKVQSIQNQMTGYSFEQANVIFPIYIRMDDVSAVIDEGEYRDDEHRCRFQDSVTG